MMCVRRLRREDFLMGTSTTDGPQVHSKCAAFLISTSTIRSQHFILARVVFVTLAKSFTCDRLKFAAQLRRRWKTSACRLICSSTTAEFCNSVATRYPLCSELPVPSKQHHVSNLSSNTGASAYLVLKNLIARALPKK